MITSKRAAFAPRDGIGLDTKQKGTFLFSGVLPMKPVPAAQGVAKIKATRCLSQQVASVWKPGRVTKTGELYKMSPVIHTPTWSDEEQFLPDEIAALMDAYISTDNGTVPSVINTTCIEGLRRIHKRGLVRRVKILKTSPYNLDGRREYFRLTKLGLKVTAAVLEAYRRAVKMPLDLAG